jgi:NarL family two-component system response regulator LiaR
MTLIATLTKQEVVVLALVAKGWRNSRIAGELSISIRTVETHLTNIFGKLNVNSRTEAALYVIRTEQARVAQMSGSHDDAPVGSHYAGR